MARVSPPPAMMYSPSFSQQQMLPTPSPFTNSLASSGGWRTSETTLHLISNIFLRFVAFSFLAVSFLSLLAAPTHNNNVKGGSPNILQHFEFRYCLGIAICASMYSGFQLFIGIHSIAFKGQFISGNIYDFATFVGDQLVAYFLVSSVAAAAPAIQRVHVHKNVAIASVSMSVFAFLVVAVCTLVSGYKLCKRIIW